MLNTPRVVVLTGAGVSAESGIRTFRDNGGLWEQHRIEEVATPEAFAENPALVYRFYNTRRAQLQMPAIEPNSAHRALVKLEQHLGNNFLLITQNVDDLHERAGTTRILHMHGSLLSARCCQSGRSHRWNGSFDQSTPCPCCLPASQMRPDIVWFGEMPMHMEAIGRALTDADIFVAIGTSGTVYPAAGFVELAKQYGARTVEMNLQKGACHSLFDESVQGTASSTVVRFVEEIIALTERDANV